MSKQLPVIQETGSLRRDGSRAWVHPADVTGRFTSLRRVIFAVLILVYVVMPWIDIGGHPAVFLDIARRKFFLFGLTFNAQDAWLAFFLFTGAGFSLMFLTAMLGRVWCGYACPQTVFLDGVFRRIERALEGPRNERIRRNASPMSFDKAWRKGLKHILFVALSLAVAHVFLSYFVSLPGLFSMMKSGPADHMEAFLWMVGVSLAMYVNFAWFREQFCLIVCPYGRLQSVLMDRDSVIIGYDEARGEPRGKAKDASKGDCVDCNRCVVVCPTGIDIRDGSQLDCIGCANCVDACDDIMARLGRPKGLVRYDSLNGLAGEKRRIIRPRLFLYAALGMIGAVVASLAFQSRTAFEANLLRQRGAPFVVVDEGVRNAFELHLVNKNASPMTLHVKSLNPALQIVLPRESVTLGSLESLHLPVFVTVPRDGYAPKGDVSFEIRSEGSEESPTEIRKVHSVLLGPARLPPPQQN